MHILHVTPYYAPAYSFGGVVAVVEGLAKAQQRRGHQVTILTTDALTLNERYLGARDEVQDGIRVIRAPNILYSLRRYNLSTPRKMKELAEALLPQVDIVHLHEFRTVENLLVTPAAAKLGKPLLLSPHGTLNLSTGRSKLKALWDKLLSPGVAQRIDHLVALVQNELDDAEMLWPSFGRRRVPTEFSIIPNGIDPDTFATLPDAQPLRDKYGLEDARVLLFMGRLQQRKGVYVLAKAFLQANIPNTKLLIVGPDEGMRESLEMLADERIVLTGYISGEARLQAFSAADLFALPATGEGLSMAVLEAMGAGLPVLLSPGCNLPEAAEQGAGRIVEPEIEPLALALREMFADETALREMGDSARQLVLERFTWDRVVVQLEALYDTILQIRAEID